MTATIEEAAERRRPRHQSPRSRPPWARSDRGRYDEAFCAPGLLEGSPGARPRASTASSSPASTTRASPPPASSSTSPSSASPRPPCTRPRWWPATSPSSPRSPAPPPHGGAGAALRLRAPLPPRAQRRPARPGPRGPGLGRPRPPRRRDRARHQGGRCRGHPPGLRRHGRPRPRPLGRLPHARHRRRRRRHQARRGPGRPRRDDEQDLRLRPPAGQDVHGRVRPLRSGQVSFFLSVAGCQPSGCVSPRASREGRQAAGVSARSSSSFARS